MVPKGARGQVERGSVGEGRSLTRDRAEMESEEPEVEEQSLQEEHLRDPLPPEDDQEEGRSSEASSEQED